MCSKNVPTYTSLAIARILDQYTDDDHAISITRLRHLLATIYGIRVSDDTVRKLVRGIVEFHRLGCPRDATGRKVEEFDTPNLFPQAEVEFLPQGAGAGPRAGVRISQRVFDDAEVDFMAAAVCAVFDADSARSGDLLARIHSLQGPEARQAAQAAQAGAEADQAAGIGSAGDPRIGLTEFASDLVLLREAIKDKRTVSFDCVRYELRPTVGGRVKVAVPDGARRMSLSPYRLECVDGRYCLLAGAKGGGIRAYRVDLMRGVEVDPDGSSYAAPADSALGRRRICAGSDSPSGASGPVPAKDARLQAKREERLRAPLWSAAPARTAA